MKPDAPYAIREMEARDLSRCIWIRTHTRENCYTLEGLRRAGITEESGVQRLASTHKGWVCEADGQIVGFSMADQSNGEFWVVAVLPEFEGRGIGRALTEAAQQWLHSSGWREIWLWTSPDTSTRAYALYHRLGWCDCEVKDGQLIMRHAVPDAAL